MKLCLAKDRGLVVRALSTDSAELILYAAIGQDWWGDGSMLSAKNFSDEMKKLPATTKNLSLRINSPGGDVFDGITIYNRLLAWKKETKGRKLTVYIDGLAASIASIIALAGDEVVIGEGALYMVHLPWTFAYGNRLELDDTVNRLMDIEEQMLGIYAKKSGMDRDEIKQLLEAETWLGADEAIDYGFVDSKAEETVAIAASAMKHKWINKAPKKFHSENDIASKQVSELKAKVAAVLDRSKRISAATAK